jgi:ferrous iron transport protein A
MNSAVFPKDPITLLECRKGTRARVTAVLDQPLFGEHDARVSLRLKELGFLPGVSIEVIGFGLLRADPLAVKVNGTKFALRRTEAAKIGVEIIPTGKD